MKKSLLTAVLLTASVLAFAQNNPINFEAGGQGAGWTWTVFENGTNPAVEIVDNPGKTGINTSDKVAKFTALAAGQPWAGAESAKGGADLGNYVISSTNSIIKVMVWKSVISPVGVKFATTTGWAQAEIKVSNTKVNEWEELTFDFSNNQNPPPADGVLNQFIIFPDFGTGARTADNVVYFDNVTFSAKGGGENPPTGPTESPVPPAREPADVLSVFSDAYTNVAGTDFNPNWSQSTVVTTVKAGGNDVLKYASFNYQGTQFASPLNVSGMEKIHLNMWTGDATTVNFFLISPGPKETPYSLQVTPNQWGGYDIPLTHFTAVNLAEVIQFKFDGGNGSQTIYLDNIYFYKGSGGGEPPVTATPANPVTFEAGGAGANWTWTTFENGTNPAVEIIDNPDKSGLNVSAKVAKFTALTAGQPWAGAESKKDGSDLGTFVIGPTNSTVKVMVWKSVISPVGVKFATSNGWAQQELKVSNTKVNQWEELTFDFSTYQNPPPAEGVLNQFIIFPDFGTGARSADNVVYFDNISFHPKSGGEEPAPGFCATPVTHLGIPAETASAINLSIYNTGANTMKVVIESADADPADDLIVNSMAGDITGAPAIGDIVNEGGKLSRTLTWAGSAPAEIELNVLWSKASFGGNWMLSDKNVKVSFASTCEGTGPANAPVALAPAPQEPATDVISLFSSAYTNVKVDTWRTDWSAAAYDEFTVGAGKVKRYSNLDFVGIETVSEQINISEMTHIRLDVWSPDFTQFSVKLVDFGADGAYAGGDDTEHQVNFTNLQKGRWERLNIPLVEFAGMTGRNNLAQIIFVGQPTGAATVFVDNLYFYKAAAMPTEPAEAAVAPTIPAADVISLFGTTYTNVPVDTWRTEWSVAGVEDVTIAGAPMKKYVALDYAGIETVASQIDLTEMTRVHFDIWSPDMTNFGVKLVDYGADGAYQGGDDTEHQINIANPGIGRWVTIDLPLADFTGKTGKKNLAQIIIVAQPAGTATVFLGNLFFYKTREPQTAPVEVAALPTAPSDKVISLFSRAYTSVAVDTWRTEWSVADYSEVQIGENTVKRYAKLSYAGIETVSSQLDVTGMTHFRVDVWTPDATTFSVKLVDFGADGAFAGGDDTEHQINIPNIKKGEWVSLNLPLADFTGLMNRKNMAQVILVAQPVGAATVFVDNMYFYNDGGTSNENGGVKVTEFALHQNYPNPFNPSTVLSYSLPKASDVTLEVFNIHGQRVATVEKGFKSAGTHNVSFNASGLASGVYLYRLTAGGVTRMNKMMLIK
jgi:hypothetical protein